MKREGEKHQFSQIVKGVLINENLCDYFKFCSTHLHIMTLTNHGDMKRTAVEISADSYKMFN